MAWYEGRVADRVERDQSPAMKKRALAAILWFNAGWFAGAALAFLLGLNPVLGPIVAVVATALIVVDPRKIIWPPAPAAPTLLEAVRG